LFYFPQLIRLQTTWRIKSITF